MPHELPHPLYTRTGKRYPKIDRYGRSSWDRGDEDEGYHRDWDGYLHSSAEWRDYYSPRSRWNIKPDKWAAARLIRTRYRQGVITSRRAAEEAEAAGIPLQHSGVHRFCTGETYWWL